MRIHAEVDVEGDKLAVEFETTHDSTEARQAYDEIVQEIKKKKPHVNALLYAASVDWWIVE